MLMDILWYKDDEVNFTKAYNELARNSNRQWPHWMPFNKVYNYERLIERSHINDISFIIKNNDKPVMGLLGFSCYNPDIIDVPSIIIENSEIRTAKIQKNFFKVFDNMPLKNHSFWLRDFLENGNLSEFSKKLLREGAQAKLTFAQVLDLTLDIESLRKQIRKSYKSLINKGFEEMDIKIFNYENINQDTIFRFRDLHISEAGRETKSKNSWLNKYNIVKNNEGFLVTGEINGELISAGLFSISSDYADYQVSASRSYKNNKPLFHSLMWKAIDFAKAIGCKYFEIGEIVYRNHPNISKPLEKEIGISTFKSGFGGFTKAIVDVEMQF